MDNNTPFDENSFFGRLHGFFEEYIEHLRTHAPETAPGQDLLRDYSDKETSDADPDGFSQGQYGSFDSGGTEREDSTDGREQDEYGEARHPAYFDGEAVFVFENNLPWEGSTQAGCFEEVAGDAQATDTEFDADFDQTARQVFAPAGGQQPGGRPPGPPQPQPPRPPQPQPPRPPQPQPPRPPQPQPPRPPQPQPPRPPQPQPPRPPQPPPPRPPQPQPPSAGRLADEIFRGTRDLEATYRNLERLAPVRDRDTVRALISQTALLSLSAAQVYRDITGRRPLPYSGRGPLPRNYCLALRTSYGRALALSEDIIRLQRITQNPSADRQLLVMAITLSSQLSTLNNLMVFCR